MSMETTSLTILNQTQASQHFTFAHTYKKVVSFSFDLVTITGVTVTGTNLNLCFNHLSKSNTSASNDNGIYRPLAWVQANPLPTRDRHVKPVTHKIESPCDFTTMELFLYSSDGTVTFGAGAIARWLITMHHL